MQQFEDRLGKMLFSRVLAPYAAVEVGTELLPNSLKADVQADCPPDLPPALPGAGLLARLAVGRIALIEPFSAAPDRLRLRSAQAKLHLALYQALLKRPDASPVPRGCLLIVSPAETPAARLDVLDGPGTEIEPGLWKWHEADPIYWIRSDLIARRPDTLIFRLLARKQRRFEAVREVYEAGVEPYRSITEEFQLRYREMESKGLLSHMSPEELAELKEIVAAQNRALERAGFERGRTEAYRAAVLRLVERQWPDLRDLARSAVASELPAEALEALFDALAAAPDTAAARAALEAPER
jgi:hypothetical protein